MAYIKSGWWLDRRHHRIRRRGGTEPLRSLKQAAHARHAKDLQQAALSRLANKRCTRPVNVVRRSTSASSDGSVEVVDQRKDPRRGTNGFSEDATGYCSSELRFDHVHQGLLAHPPSARLDFKVLIGMLYGCAPDCRHTTAPYAFTRLGTPTEEYASAFLNYIGHHTKEVARVKTAQGCCIEPQTTRRPGTTGGQGQPCHTEQYAALQERASGVLGAGVHNHDHVAATGEAAGKDKSAGRQRARHGEARGAAKEHALGTSGSGRPEKRTSDCASNRRRWDYKIEKSNKIDEEAAKQRRERAIRGAAPSPGVME